MKSSAVAQPGYFLFSLDTELAWGYYDLDEVRLRKFSPDGSRERRSIERLLDILDEFQITATWALVGHLFYAKCMLCETCPILAWQGKYESFAQIYQTDNPLWYGGDIIDHLLARGDRHEIAFHGYTHEVFSEQTMSEERARLEITEWLRAARERGIVPRTVIFPRDRIGHLSVFKELGFLCYRSSEDLSRLFRLRCGGKILKSIDHILSVSTPRVYSLESVKKDPIVDLRTSQEFFAFNRSLELALDALNLHTLRIRRMVRGVKKAAEERRILHICAHPWEFQTEKDFEKLHYLLGHVAEEIARGAIQSTGMAELASKALEVAGRE